MSTLLMSGGPFFFTRALPLFPDRGLWEFLHILIIFKKIQFSLFIYLFIPNTITPDQSGLESDGNKGVLHIFQSSCITEASP